jgi:hypothetical protein
VVLITFKSSADGDVIMFGEVGQHMLKVLGKDASDARGIITLEQLPEAVHTLQAAIEADKAAQAAHPPEDDFYAEQDRIQAKIEPIVRFAQRAVPLLFLLQHSERAGVVVTWEST